MRKIYIFLFVLTIVSLNVCAQTYTGLIPKPISGYGSNVSYTVATKSFPNPAFSDHDIVIYYLTKKQLSHE